MFYLSGKGSGMEANTERERDDGRQKNTVIKLGQSEGTGIQGRSDFAINACTIF